MKNFIALLTTLTLSFAHYVHPAKKLTERQKLIFVLRALVDENLPLRMQRLIAYADLHTSVHNERYSIKNDVSLRILRASDFLKDGETKVDRDKADNLKVLLKAAKL